MALSAWAAADAWTDWYLYGAVVVAEEQIVLAPDLAGRFTGVHQALAETDFSHTVVSLEVKVHDWLALQALQVVVSTAGNFEQYFETDLTLLASRPPSGEWLRFTLPRSAFSGSAGADWRTVNAIILRAVAHPGRQTLVLLRDVAFLETDVRPGMISLAFDDGWIDTYAVAFPRMQALGLTGTAYIIPSRLGQEGYLTQEQVDALHEAGWAIAGHSDEDLTNLSPSEAAREVASVYGYLVNRNYRGGDHYAYPDGGYDRQIRQEVARYFATGRTIDPYAQPLSGIDPYRLSSLSVYDDHDLAFLTDLIDRVVADGDWLILTFHRLTDAPPTVDTEYPLERFEALLAYLVENEVPVLTVPEVWERFGASGSR